MTFDEYRTKWKEVLKTREVTPFPMHIDIESSGLCNLKCPQCFQNDIDGKLGFMDETLYHKIIDEGAAQGLCAIKLQVRGEALLHPQIIPFIKYAKEKGIMDVQITTNALLLGKKQAPFDEMILSGLDWLIFSLDDHHRESSNNWDAENNAKEFLLRREEFRNQGKTVPKVRIQTKIYDIEQQEETQKFLRSEYAKAEVISVGGMWNSNEDEDSLDSLSNPELYYLEPCDYLWQRPTVFWDGDVTLCCRDYNGKMKLGNLNESTMTELWNGDKMTELRALHLAELRKDIPICSNCSVCVTKKSEGKRFEPVFTTLSQGK
jgi:radical SAM protein with 4Fe4S-binding SPASM domain